MSVVLTVRMPPTLLQKAEARAARLGLDRAGYVRSLIEHDVGASGARSQRRFASEDLVGAYKLGGKSATNRRAREALRRRFLAKRETNC